MQYIKGRFKSSIFSGNNGYTIGLFRVKEASDELSELENKTVTFTGYFYDLNDEDYYNFNGNYINHEKYGYQFQVLSYERIEPSGEDAIVDFLTSSFVKGCGKKTALKIVEYLGGDAIALIKQDKQNLINVGLSIKTTESIYSSIMAYYDQDELIIYLKQLGFSVKDITYLINMYGNRVKKIITEDLYSLVDVIDFKRLDKIFFNIYEESNDMRIYACIIESLKRLCFENGDTYCYKDEIYNYLYQNFNLDLYDKFDDYLVNLSNINQIVIENDKFYLIDYYKDEEYISNSLTEIRDKGININYDLEDDFAIIEKEFLIKYNDEQKRAIKTSLENNVTIITGGPGTGKTTIINGILRMYQIKNRFNSLEMGRNVSLLAPTGRASKRMSEATNFKAMTIHRYLKWNHELKEFAVNEYNTNKHKLIIIDEISMVDNELFASLLKGIDHNVKLVLVGDENQLPSVGPGNILYDLIDSDRFSHVSLTNIYRQSENSFIPILASEIKKHDIESNILEKKDDYNFLQCDKSNIKDMIRTIIDKSLDKGLKESEVQVLAPMYKGENGIDNLNMILQNLFNPKRRGIDEVRIGDVIYRLNDKVINLVNNIDQNIFNGDIGYIVDINEAKSDEFMTIDFYGNYVTLKRDMIGTIRHAYAMSIHKSQGSEFNHVIIPLSREFNRMLYNKLLYTGVSRAKKSLVLVGDVESFMHAVKNNYSIERKTSLKSKLMNRIK